MLEFLISNWKIILILIVAILVISILEKALHIISFLLTPFKLLFKAIKSAFIELSKARKEKKENEKQ